jgi:hypothetical protein
MVCRHACDVIAVLPTWITKATATMLLCAIVCAWARPACAYRPFDSTDASVARRGEIEIEFGPLGYLVEDDQRFVVFAATILNVGVIEDWEIVIEGRGFRGVDSTARLRRTTTLGDTAASLKGVLRRGSLQDGTGPSIATEIGVLLPTIGAEPGVGASFAGIVSQRWRAVIVHVNATLLITRKHDLGGVVGVILEGPSRWTIRPVAEVLVERNQERTTSGLLGAIWQVRDNLSFDTGYRIARVTGSRGKEWRAGLTWAFPLR